MLPKKRGRLGKQKRRPVPLDSPLARRRAIARLQQENEELRTRYDALKLAVDAHQAAAKVAELTPKLGANLAKVAAGIKLPTAGGGG